MSRNKVITEYEMQKEFVKWVRLNHPTVLFCATVGGKSCHMIENVKARATGYNRGVPDLIFYEARNGYHGLAMELKTANGVIMPAQQEWLDSLNKRKYKACVPRSVDECKSAFTEYFEKKPR
jgi:VRR-NUC domain